MSIRALLISAVLFTCLIAAPTAAQDVPSPPDLPPGEDRVEVAPEGSRAPYEGMLLDTDTAIRWTNRLRWWPETFRLHLAEDLEVLEALRRSHDTEMGIVRDSLTREVEGLRTDLRDAVLRYETELARHRNPPFYETWGFAFGMGVVLTGVVVALVGGLVLGI